MKVIVKKCNGGEWYGKALNHSFEVVKKVAINIMKLRLIQSLHIFKWQKKAYIYTSDADVI